MKSILLVTDKWCDGKPSMAISPTYPTFLKTLTASSEDIVVHTLHYDESMAVYGKHIDEVLLKYCETWKQDAIIFSLMGESPMLPSIEVFKKLKELNIPTCILWSDTGPTWGLGTINKLKDLVTLHVSIDNPSSQMHEQYLRPFNHIYLWCPPDINHFFPQEQKDIDISFIGSLRYCYRQQFLDIVKEGVPDLFIGGGQREEQLTTEGYASLIRRSKMSINFAMSPALFFQTKARVLEVISSKTLLFESKNRATASLLEEGKEYIQFTNPEDLIDKIKYYKENPVKRDEIANNGYEAFKNRLSSKTFWNTILGRLL